MRSPAGVNPKMKTKFAKINKKIIDLFDKSQTCSQNWSKESSQWLLPFNCRYCRSIQDFSNHIYNIYKVEWIVTWAELVDNPLIYQQPFYLHP